MREVRITLWRKSASAYPEARKAGTVRWNTQSAWYPVTFCTRPMTLSAPRRPMAQASRARCTVGRRTQATTVSRVMTA